MMTPLILINIFMIIIQNYIIMDEKHELLKLACYTTENAETGRIIEVALWNEKDILGHSIATIATGEGQLVLTLPDLSDLMASIKSIIDVAI